MDTFGRYRRTASSDIRLHLICCWVLAATQLACKHSGSFHLVHSFAIIRSRITAPRTSKLIVGYALQEFTARTMFSTYLFYQHLPMTTAPRIPRPSSRNRLIPRMFLPDLRPTSKINFAERLELCRARASSNAPLHGRTLGRR